jgi:hypothetical protein
MVVRILNFFATPQVGDFSFKHQLIGYGKGMLKPFPVHQSLAECHGIIEIIEFTDPHPVKLPPVIRIGNNMGIKVIFR